MTTLPPQTSHSLGSICHQRRDSRASARPGEAGRAGLGVTVPQKRQALGGERGPAFGIQWVRITIKRSIEAFSNPPSPRSAVTHLQSRSCQPHEGRASTRQIPKALSTLTSPVSQDKPRDALFRGPLCKYHKPKHKGTQDDIPHDSVTS